jgi:spermidine/putrescine transport system permease protein
MKLGLPSIAFLIAFFYIPFAIVILYAFGYPEYTLKHFRDILNPIYGQYILNSVVIATLTTVLCLIISYPVAYYIALKSTKWKNALLVAVILPFWISFLLRTYALMTILSKIGVLFTFTAVIIGMVYDYLPFMILPLYTSLERLKVSTIEASYVLGATPLKTFFKVVLPLSKQGMIAGVFLVFVPSLGEFVVPAMLGGVSVSTLGTLTWELFIRYHNWWRGSALSVIYIAVVFAFTMYYVRKVGRLEI